jgi:hypothetical protein
MTLTKPPFEQGDAICEYSQKRDHALGRPRRNSSRFFQRGIELARSQDEPTTKKRPIREQHMTRPRAADDFETIRARMEELRRERTELDEAERAALAAELRQ